MPPRGPRYNRKQKLYVTEEMLSWGEKKPPKKPDYVPPPPPPLPSVAYVCPFCGSNQRQHECHVFAGLLQKQRDKKVTIRAGVPWDWAIVHYFMQRHMLPSLPFDGYDGYKEGAEIPYLEWLSQGAKDDEFPEEGISAAYLALFRHEHEVDGEEEQEGGDDDAQEAG